VLRKPRKTPLEDALGQGSGDRITQLVQWARRQQQEYYSSLSTWRENRRKYAQEAQDVFEHRRRDSHADAQHGPRLIFNVQNDSLNIVAGLAEFAAAQAELDIFGGDPWFAAVPEGRKDAKLAATIQKHLEWTFRDGRLVSAYCEAITTAAALGEAITKTTYDIESDESEEELVVLHADGKPLMVDDETYVTTERQARKALPRGARKLAWKPIYRKKSLVVRQGAETTLLHPNDVAFREDAPSLELRHTNFYNLIELRVTDAITRFHLSVEDALRLAEVASVHQAGDQAQRPQHHDAPPTQGRARNQEYGEEDRERLLNTRIRLIEGFVSVDPFGDGKSRRLYLVFPPQSDDWLVFGDYLANVSPKAELPVKIHPWEKVPGRCYGRGFFAKYAAVQSMTDDTWNQVNYRNRMHATPVGGWHPEMLERDEDDADLRIEPGLMLKLRGDHKLDEALEFVRLPDLDQRSMELMQIGIQMAQMRSGISSASQGDLTGIPENNTATGIRQLMSRAAVLLRKPVRWLRRSLGQDFQFAVKLTYANFDRDEAFVWGEGKTAELLKLTAEQVQDLDIDIRMLLTQEQNQTKLDGAKAAIDAVSAYIGLPEAEKASARPIFTQAIRALEFEGAEQIIRQPVLVLEDVKDLLPPEEQKRLAALLQSEAAADAEGPGADVAEDVSLPSGPAAPGSGVEAGVSIPMDTAATQDSAAAAPGAEPSPPPGTAGLDPAMLAAALGAGGMNPPPGAPPPATPPGPPAPSQDPVAALRALGISA